MKLLILQFSSLNVTDRVPHLYIASTVIVLHVLISIPVT